MSSDNEAVRLTIGEGIATITLDRPPLNILDIATMATLNTVLEQALSNRETGVLLVRAEGKAFCAGLDVADHTPDKVAEMMHEFTAIFYKLVRTDVPLVAAVQGAALGGGMELIACCDIVLASDRAKFGQPEIKLGVFPPVAAAVLPRVCGLMQAMDIVLTGRAIFAEEGKALGFVAEVYPADGFEARVDEYMKQFASLSRPVLRATKRATLQGLRGDAERRIAEAERAYMDELMKMHDPVEGLAAFVEKRAPRWRHA